MADIWNAGGNGMEFRYDCPHLGPSLGTTQFYGDPDLIFLREDLADELGAIVAYQECAAEIRDRRISEQFREIAKEEAGHFIGLFRMVGSLDPVQAEELKQQGLVMLAGYAEPTIAMGRPCAGCGNTSGDNREAKKNTAGEHRRFESDLRDLDCLRKAIRDELHAINAYQRQIQATNNQSIRQLLTAIMNKEKEHAAEFTKIFHEMQHKGE